MLLGVDESSRSSKHVVPYRSMSRELEHGRSARELREARVRYVSRNGILAVPELRKRTIKDGAQVHREAVNERCLRQKMISQIWIQKTWETVDVDSAHGRCLLAQFWIPAVGGPVLVVG